MALTRSGLKGALGCIWIRGIRFTSLCSAVDQSPGNQWTSWTFLLGSCLRPPKDASWQSSIRSRRNFKWSSWMPRGPAVGSTAFRVSAAGTREVKRGVKRGPDLNERGKLGVSQTVVRLVWSGPHHPASCKIFRTMSSPSCFQRVVGCDFCFKRYVLLGLGLPALRQIPSGQLRP